MKMMNN